MALSRARIGYRGADVTHRRRHPNTRAQAEAGQRGELGGAPFRITEQMRGRNILGDLTLKQVQKFKSNHAKKILGLDVFNGNTTEYEVLLTECSIESVDRDRAGVGLR